VTQVPQEQLVFVDEMGVHLAMTPTMARSAVGTRAYGTVPAVRAANVSVAAAVRGDEVVAWRPHDGAVDGDRFAEFVDEQLVCKLRPGDVVVMDNVRFHKIESIKTSIEAVGARVLFIPAYHPEFNAIEEVFSVVKTALRRLEPRNIVELFDALTTSFGSLTSAKLYAFVRHMLGFAIQPE
jgi:transposase